MSSRDRSRRLPIVARGQRRGVPGHDGNVLQSLQHGHDDAIISQRSGYPVATIHGVRTFYDSFRHPGRMQRCAGTACWAARQAVAKEARSPVPTADGAAGAYCLGRCYDAPCDRGSADAPIPHRALVDEMVILEGLNSPELGANWRKLYAVPDGPAILGALDASGLRGRGGAAYPTGAKWRATADTDPSTKYVVANGDEGDPGSYVDRLLLRRAPHRVLAGMNACARAIGAQHGIVYIRAEYEETAALVKQAIAEADDAKLFCPGFSVRVQLGAGSYVCGEETALLRSLEGLRGEAQPKPPYPAQVGLFGMPTVVQNIETLSVVSWVLRTHRRPQTKAFCLSGVINTPGVVEAPLGIRLRELLTTAGDGAPPGRSWKMALVGGPMGRVIPECDFDIALGYDSLPGMGHGGIVVFDESISASALAHHLYAFAASESCGSCSPCRIGSAKLADMASRDALERLLDTLRVGSLCGFGIGVTRPIRDLLQHFPSEMPR